MARWLVVGAAGQLGHDFMEILPADDVVGMDLPDIDITSAASVATALEAVAPDIVVNCAAYTAVDAAEDDEATALLVNGTGPAVLAAAVAERPGIRLVQISTDYVFDGSATSPYAEDAPINPASAYGRTKAVGEEAVLTALPDRGYVVRTAWLYGVNGANFVKTMLRLQAQHPSLRVVDDQRGQPTWSRDLAHQIVALMDADAPAGVYHGTATGETTWCGFTKAIFELGGQDPDRVVPTTTDEYPRPAPRPAYSVLGHRRGAEVDLTPMRPWDEALAEALPLIVAAEASQA